jgi:multiple sugar transport system substrate-binding protein
MADPSGELMTVTRRNFLAGSAGGAALLGLAACSSVHSGTNADSTAAGSGGAAAPTPSDAGSKANLGKVSGELTFAFWGGSAGETAGFTNAKKKFEAANPGAKINLKIAPYDSFFSGIDRGIQSGNAPDIFRVDYTTIGKYSKAGVLLDVSPYFSASEVDNFLPALWEAIKYNGVPYGIPHQTDTTCIVYNKKAFSDAGITSVPDSLQNAWSWDEFAAVSAKLRKSLPANKFPFAYDWTQAGAFRWLSFLYQAGGTLLTSDLSKCALPSDAGTKALDFTKSFFDKKWVPANNTIKTSVYSDNFFLNQTVPMTFIGDFLVPELADPKTGYKGGDWGATYMPQDKAAASDLGGNAIVALKSTKNPDLAGAFLKFLASEDIMKYFCEQAVELPTLKTLASSSLNYAYRPDVVKICAEQATTISDTVVKECTTSSFATINTILQDQLELAFHGQSTSATLGSIATKVNQAL